jgi:two-component system, OmpR family, phosphate regulon sensor histidine kinase PhoR
MTTTKAHNRSLLIFYLLVGYVVLQFSWWAYHIYTLAQEVGKEESFVQRKIMMITGEALVFFLILAVGVYFVRKTFNKELELAKEKKNFILSVTHELKTPIASSKLFAETILSRDIPKEKRDDILDKIIKDQTRLEKLVENILLISKVEEHEQHLEREKVNCREFIESVIMGLDLSETARVDIDSEIEINIDRFYFTSVIQNLHENAVKYSKDKEEIVWSAQQLGNSTFIQIKDQGIGVPSNQREKIFDLFHRIGDENTRDTKGTGVGLYIVQKIVALHNGTIKTKDNQPKGSVFEIELPK